MALMPTRSGDVEDADGTPAGPVRSRRRIYPWVVFGLAFALLLSDYMSRQVLAAVFVPRGRSCISTRPSRARSSPWSPSWWGC
ncbi:hypothetical protein MTP03_21430 [Tsukamurella sp. PLM1]|nr:hypothetical protein MTP03_21430 [Tsukamurella sp. PLM1]